MFKANTKSRIHSEKYAPGLGFAVVRHKSTLPISFRVTSLSYMAFSTTLTHCGIWHNRTWSTLVLVMACCLMAPSHYLNQCWLIISKVFWHSPEGSLIGYSQKNLMWENYSNELNQIHQSITNEMVLLMQWSYVSFAFKSFISCW